MTWFIELVVTDNCATMMTHALYAIFVKGVGYYLGPNTRADYVHNYTFYLKPFFPFMLLLQTIAVLTKTIYDVISNLNDSSKNIQISKWSILLFAFSLRALLRSLDREGCFPSFNSLLADPLSGMSHTRAKSTSLSYTVMIVMLL